MQTLKVYVEGVGPMLMHNATFANPLDPSTILHKGLTSKRKKTEEDQLAIAKSEWISSLYCEKKSGPYLPGINMESCIFEAGKLRKLGKTLKRAIIISEDQITLEYKGPRDPEAMFANAAFVDARAVKVGTSKIIRYRPKFVDWKAEFTINFNPEQISRDELVDVLIDAGQLIGCGDFRPRFGKFSVEVK